jgi:DNA-binding LytR/AlgR family response regulator
MTCIIIDDEPSAIGVLEFFIEKVPYLTLLGSFKNPIEAIECVRQNKPDITFLDIQMEIMSGMEVARLIQDKTNIVFTTAHAEYAIESFDYIVLDYLMKPIAFERFMKAIQKVPSQSKEQEHLFIKTDVRGKMSKIMLDDVLYIEGYGNYVKFHKASECVVALLTFKELEERLSPSQFIRVHKSHIVAIDQISGIEGNEIIIGYKTKEIKIPVGGTYRDDLLTIIKPHVVGGR